MNRRFEYAPMPSDYPGKHLWWTLRFVGVAPLSPIAPGELAKLRLVWGRSGVQEWVDAAALAVGDEALGGHILAITEISGETYYKVDLGQRATRLVPRRTLTEKVERRAPRTSRSVQIEFEGSPRRFDESAFEGYLQRVHQEQPLLAVLFQEGQFVAGESLVDLEDAALLARLREAPAGP